MTLATVPRAAVLPRSPARDRVAQAAKLLQDAVDGLYREAREEAAKRERTYRENAAERERRVALAAAREATRALRLEVGTKWFWDFTADAIDCMHQLAQEARRQGQQAHADALEVRIDAAVKELDRIQQRQARGAGQ
jgi:hypothetical protein